MIDQVRTDVDGLYSRMDEMQGKFHQKISLVGRHISTTKEKLEFIELAHEYD